MLGAKGPFFYRLVAELVTQMGQAYPELIQGGMVSDAVITMSSLNLIAGELDA